jgi:hypothetical protein
MATEIDNAKPEKTFSNQSIVTADLETSVANLSLQDETSQTEPGDAPDRQKPAIPPQRLIIYTRSQLLLLHNSPLVKAPPDMPSLKEWFG